MTLALSLGTVNVNASNLITSFNVIAATSTDDIKDLFVVYENGGAVGFNGTITMPDAQDETTYLFTPTSPLTPASEYITMYVKTAVGNPTPLSNFLYINFDSSADLTLTYKTVESGTINASLQAKDAENQDVFTSSQTQNDLFRVLNENITVAFSVLTDKPYLAVKTNTDISVKVDYSNLNGDIETRLNLTKS